MCMGTSNGAQREATAAEATREANIRQTTGEINALFDSPERTAQRNQYGNDVRTFLTEDANRQKGVADRNLKFAMARSGLTGGSATVDANRTLGQDYQRGILNAEQKTQGAIADLMGRDEQSRLNLTGLAQSGLSAAAAAQQGAAGLRANLAGANAAAIGNGLGDIFGSIETIKRNSETNAAQRRADQVYARKQMYSPFGGPF